MFRPRCVGREAKHQQFPVHQVEEEGLVDQGRRQLLMLTVRTISRLLAVSPNLVRDPHLRKFAVEHDKWTTQPVST
jgi:hypothetical protein